MLACLSLSIIHLCANYTKVKNMVVDIFLSQDQIKELRFFIKGHGAMQRLVKRCDEKNICSRRTTFDAVTAATYDGENPLHRLAVNEAVKMLKEDYSVNFPWAEVQPEHIEA